MKNSSSKCWSKPPILSKTGAETFNIEHSIPNAEAGECRILVGCWALNVECRMFPSLTPILNLPMNPYRDAKLETRPPGV